MFQVGNQELDIGQFGDYIDSLPVGPERKAHTLRCVHGAKQLPRFLRDWVDCVRRDGSYRAAGKSDEWFENLIAPAIQKSESELRMLGGFEDMLTEDPRARALAVIAYYWGAEVCDHFRSSTQSKPLLKAVVKAAMVFPVHTTARRLVNEKVLTRLEDAKTAYRRNKNPLFLEWVGIRTMPPIATPIDPLRLLALGVHLGKLDVIEEGLGSDSN